MKQQTVLVGMSGGVDSSVSAALLVQQGYKVIGGFIKNWSDAKNGWTGECAWRGERRDALRVAAQLGIPLLTFDFENEYRERVVAQLFRGYAAGETPNPDVLCNEAIKFGLFLDEAKKIGADFMATGHYARIEHATDGSARLLRGLDPNKDQSYFLYRVPQSALRQSLFPIGNLEKSAVRQLAHSLALPVADKPDSQGICFIGKLDMQDFLRTKIPARPGDIIDENGKKLGEHAGLDGYTIGQRQGILVSNGELPWFVAQKNLEKNQLIVVQGAEHPALFVREATINDLHWTSGAAPLENFECEVQVRYRQQPVMAHCRVANGLAQLIFAQPVKAVASGQSAVLYVGDQCLGGGIII